MDPRHRVVLCLIPLLSLVTASRLDDRVALLIIDVQTCFTPGGTLEVPDGEDVIPVINDLRTRLEPHFHLVVLTQDWHCRDHVSFASQHPGHEPLSQIELHYDDGGSLCQTSDVTSDYAVNCTDQEVGVTLTQTLWPDHCVINTTDAALHPDVSVAGSDVIIQKGYRCDLDSYSAFYDNGGFSETELRALLTSQGITHVYITGLARDYCVYYTAKDAKDIGYETFVVLDATRGVAADTSAAAVEDMVQRGIHVIDSDEVEASLPGGPASGTPSRHATGIFSHLVILTCCVLLETQIH